jgi:hypothetical protein
MRKKISNHLLFISVFSFCIFNFCFPLNVKADQKRYGRDAQGQAYRVNEDGFRLFDQMAELEVTIDELRRQVVALENELESPPRQATWPPPIEISTERISESTCVQYTNPLTLQIANLHEEIKDLRIRNQELMELSVKIPTPEKQIVKKLELPTKSVSEKYEENVVGRKKDLQNELHEIQSLIGMRKSLIDTLKEKKSGVSIQLQHLRANNGDSLDTLRAEITRLDDSSETLRLNQGLREIRRILEEDITMLKRVTSL